MLLLWLCAAAMVAYVQRMAIGVAAPEIQSSLGLSESAMGIVMSAYYWAYALCQVPAGILAGRLGSRRMLALSVTATSVFSGLVGLATSSWTLTAFWLFSGITIAGIFPSCVRAISAWFPTDRRAFPSGALSSAMSIGGALSTWLTGWLLVSLQSSVDDPWRAVFLLSAIPGFAWAIGYFAWAGKHPEHIASRQIRVSAGRTRTAELNVTEDEQSRSEQWQPFQSPTTTDEDTPADGALLDRADWLVDWRTWLICSQQLFRAGGYVFYGTWFPTYLKEVHGVSLASAGGLTSLPLLGIVLGGAIGGWLSDWIERRTGSKRLSRQFVGVSSHGLCGVLILGAQFIEDPIPAVCLISLGSFIFALGSSGSYAITMDLGGSRAPTLFALMNMCGNFGAALSPIIVGGLISYVGWSSVLPFFGLIYLAAAGCWMFLNPSSTR